MTKETNIEPLEKRLADAFATADATGDAGKTPGTGLTVSTTRGPSYKPAVDAAVSVLDMSQPWLGYATTQQLLDEIAARIDVDQSNGGGGLDYRTVDHD